MCLKVDHQKTADVKQTNQDECVIRYKVVRANDKEVTSLYYNEYIWQEGENVAKNFEGYELDLNDAPEADYIHSGIHVYVTEKLAEWFAAWHQMGDEEITYKVTYKVMTVKCYIKDLIAISEHEKHHIPETEVYTKVYVEKLPNCTT